MPDPNKPFTWINSFNRLSSPVRWALFIIPIGERRKLRPRVVKPRAQGHTAKKRESPRQTESWPLEPGRPSSSAQIPQGRQLLGAAWVGGAHFASPSPSLLSGSKDLSQALPFRAPTSSCVKGGRAGAGGSKTNGTVAFYPHPCGPTASGLADWTLACRDRHGMRDPGWEGAGRSFRSGTSGVRGPACCHQACHQGCQQAAGERSGCGWLISRRQG